MSKKGMMGSLWRFVDKVSFYLYKIFFLFERTFFRFFFKVFLAAYKVFLRLVLQFSFLENFLTAYKIDVMQTKLEFDRARKWRRFTSTLSPKKGVKKWPVSFLWLQGKHWAQNKDRMLCSVHLKPVCIIKTHSENNNTKQNSHLERQGRRRKNNSQTRRCWTGVQNLSAAQIREKKPAESSGRDT